MDFIDTHCHLDFEDLQKSPLNLTEVLANMQNNEVELAITISVELEKWQGVHNIALSNKNIFCSVGVHPDYEKVKEPTIEELVKLAKLPKVVAIGECGLDYHYFPDKPKWQEERFITHINAAKITQKPLVIHSRDCGERMIEILKSENAGVAGGVMHCFTDTWDIAKEALDLGLYISFSGIVSFKNAKDLHEVAKKTPSDKFVIETDSPYLAPTPNRGKINQPAYVKHVAEALAILRNCPLAQIAFESSSNANKLFNFEKYSLH